MTPEQFHALAHLRRRHLRALGFSDSFLEAVRYPVESFSQPVPARRIAYLRLPSVRTKRKGKAGEGIYRKTDVVQFLGPEFGTNGRAESLKS